MTSKLLFSDSEWDFETLEKTWKCIDDIGKNTLGFDYYDAQIEVISSEQMLDNYSTHAMPNMYNHWSFGKSFIQNEQGYNKGQQGLAYEVVINTNPSIAYLMENNTMTMQALVLAHASVGHSSFFKTNYLFTGWTEADSILDFLKFAKNFILKCEEQYGATEVEYILDAAHSLQLHGVDKYKKNRKSDAEHAKMREERENVKEQTFSDVWRTVAAPFKIEPIKWDDKYFSEENLLYFIEKNSPILQDWQRELLGIVRRISQYFYPQRQTGLMNEGFACLSHHTIMTEMFDRGHINEGSYLEFLQSHSSVVYQPEWQDKWYSGINIYALGYAMMRDIKRMCISPDKEDLKWFPEMCNTDWRETVKHIVANYRDESFVMQFLSPKIIRNFKLFSLDNDSSKDYYQVGATHDDDDVYDMRKILSSQYDLSRAIPQIEIVHVDWNGDRTLSLIHIVHDDKLLEFKEARKTMEYIHHLWGFTVNLEYFDTQGNRVETI